MSGTQKVIAPVAGMPKIACEPWPSCQNQVSRPNVAPSERRLSTTALTARSRRPEGPGEQQERHDGDEREHQREVPEHGVAVVLLDGPDAGDPDDARLVVDCRLHGAHGREGDVVHGLDVGDRDDVGGAGPAPRRSRGQDDGGDAGSAAQARRDCRPGGGGREHLDRAEHAVRHAAVEQGLVGGVRRPGLGERRGAGLADLQLEDRKERDDEHDERDPCGEEAVTGHTPRPCAPGAAGVGLGPDPGPVDAGPDAREDRGQERVDDEDRHKRDEHAADAGAAQPGDREHDEGDEADRDGDPGERRPPARRSRPR